MYAVRLSIIYCIRALHIWDHQCAPWVHNIYNVLVQHKMTTMWCVSLWRSAGALRPSDTPSGLSLQSAHLTRLSSITGLIISTGPAANHISTSAACQLQSCDGLQIWAQLKQRRYGDSSGHIRLLRGDCSQYSCQARYSTQLITLIHSTNLILCTPHP